MTDSDPFRLPADAAADPQPAAATGKRARSQTPVRTRRILLGVLGVLVAAASVVGFYLASDAFDERTPVLVAAVDIPKGEAVGAGHFTSNLAVMGSIPHIPYTPDAPLAFEGFIAAEPIPAGTVILATMMVPPDTQPVGNQLELTVQFDTSLVATAVFDGDTVLVVVPGIDPTPDDAGRPQEAIDTLVLRDYQEDGTMTMFLEPEEWSAWRLLPEAIGAPPQILPVPLGADAEEFALTVNAAWQLEWETKAAVFVEAARAAEEEARAIQEAAAAEEEARAAETAVARGELELTVQFDTSLLTSPASNGDTVLVVDPGIEPAAEGIFEGLLANPDSEPAAGGPTRPQRAITHLELSDYRAGTMTMFFKPQREELEEWSAWRLLPEAIGAGPQIMAVPDGIDAEAFAQLVNDVWQSEWETRMKRLESPDAPLFISPVLRPGSGELPESDGLEATVPVDTSLASSPVSEGQTVLLIDPGQPPDSSDEGRPRRVLRTMELEGFDQDRSVMRLLVPSDEWLAWFEWVRLPEDLGGPPMILPLPEGAGAADETARLNGEWHEEWLAAINEVAAPEGPE